MPSFDLGRARRWDVVILPFPYSDRFAEKRRPALVISDDVLHRQYELLWVVMITSATNQGWGCDVAITDLKRAGLPAPSVVRAAKIASIEPRRVLRRAGQLPTTDAARVERALIELLNLSTGARRGR